MTTSPAGIVSREPVAIFFGAATILIDAGIVMANAFDWLSITDTQTTAVIGFVTAVSAVFGVATRQGVYSPASVAKLTRPQ